jgi:hypothetical protein
VFPEGAAALAIAAVLFGGSFLESRARRAAVAMFALVVLFGAMFRESLHLSVFMGDYDNFAGHGQAPFAHYFDAGDLEFQFHLGGAVVRVFDAWYGKTDESPVAAFHALSRLIAFVLCVLLAAFAWFQQWSPRVLRYLALTVAMPTLVLFFGYHEFGYLPAALDATAIPLAMVALEERRRGLLSLAGVLAGVGAAFHGFGLVALGFMIVMAAAYLLFDHEARRILGGWRSPIEVAAMGVFGWTVWLPIYLIGFGLGVRASHAAERPTRPLVHAYYSAYYHRLDRPILSAHVIWVIAWEFGVCSAVLVLLLAWQRGPLVRAVAVATVPVAAFVIVFWPTQGIGNDSDFLGAAFPAAFAAAWLIARSVRLTALGLVLMIPEHVGFRHVLTASFVEGQTPPPK